MHQAPRHIPVLLAECLELLAPQPGQIAVDCTAGLGGHAVEIASRLGPSGTLVLLDLDPANLAHASDRIKSLADRAPRVISCHANFADAPRVLSAGRLSANLVLADLGFASPQMDDPARGLSFMRDGPLDMRLNPLAPITAAELVNTLPERELADLLRDFGEEPAARSIAQKIVRSREQRPISTTAELATIVRSVVPRRPGVFIDPATKSFQALRIAVNDELGNLDRLLEAVRRGASLAVATPTSGWLAGGARVGVITFHSLEDRRVKQAFASVVESGSASHVTRKPVAPSDSEVAGNPRSRSAKLRVLRVDSGERKDAGNDSAPMPFG